MSAPQTPNTKEKSTPNKDKASAATTDLKDTLTLLCAALGPEVINMAVFKKMHALQPEGRTVSSWEHLFRPLKVKAKEMVKEKGGDDADGETAKPKEKAAKGNKEPKEKPKGRKRKAASGSEEEAQEGGDSTPTTKKSKSVKSEDSTEG